MTITLSTTVTDLLAAVDRHPADWTVLPATSYRRSLTDGTPSATGTTTPQNRAPTKPEWRWLSTTTKQ